MELPDAAITQHTDQSISTIHHALRSSRRRLIIALVAHQAIRKNDTRRDSITLSVREIAREITAIEQDIAITHATGDEYRSVYTSMIQTHLPELDRIRALEFNADRKIVRPAPNLLPVAMVAAITSPVARMLFHNAIADMYTEGTTDPADSITD